MSEKEKQIEEMACENCLHHYACVVNSEYVPSPCKAYESKAGYHKQSVGEWMTKGDIFKSYHCSVCNYSVDYPKQKTTYCPECGAKLKDGEWYAD